jgi:hypothetical protein
MTLNKIGSGEEKMGKLVGKENRNLKVTISTEHVHESSCVLEPALVLNPTAWLRVMLSKF